ncbi:MAG: hypothetical protein SF187_00320 [Deltaproteobacteria bacterium]|nr:hypothetical protein [Deltaproteobacteria bacterium]
MPPSVSNASRWPAFNLTAATAVVALCDLLWGRTTARLLLPSGSLSNGLNNALMALGGYFGHLAGVLSLALLVSALARPTLRQRIFPRPMQISLVFIAALFVLLSSRAMIGPVAERFTLYIKISYSFLAAFVVSGLLRPLFKKHTQPRALRPIVGVTLFALPGILCAAASVIDRTGSFEASSFAAVLNRVGAWLGLAAGIGAGFLLCPPATRRRRGAFAVAAAAGVLGTAAVFALLMTRFDLTQTLASSGLNLELPAFTDAGGRLYASAFAITAGSTLFALVLLLGSQGEWRLCGYGLALVTAGGHQLHSPALMCASLVGLMAMALGVFAVAHATDAANEQSSQRA